MNTMQKLLLGMGGFYVLIGGGITVVFLSVGQAGGFVFIPLIFVVLGMAFIIGVLAGMNGKKSIMKKGRKFPAKIYSYVENTSFMVNGRFTMNVKVHYFDENGIEREAVLPTSFDQGSNQYPIGMTIDIYEYQGKYGFDPASVRSEVLYGEEELMDDKPIDPTAARLVAMECPSCGSRFQATAGYSNKCPYCGGYFNA